MISLTTIATSWALHARGITPTAWKVLMVMAHMVNGRRGDFDVWPKQATLAEACDMPISTLKRHIQELEDKQFLVRRKRLKKSGGYSSCTYTLNVNTTIQTPNMTVTYDANTDIGYDDEDDDTLAQSELPRSPVGERARSLTGELANEYKNPEPRKNEDSPLFLTEEAPSRDLLGDIIPEDPRSVDLVAYVQAEWAKLAEEYPRIQNPRVLNDARQKKIRARAHDITKHAKGTLTPHDVWDQVFAAIRLSPFLRGDADPGKNYRDPFSLSIDYITRPTVFMNTLERAAIDAERNRHTHSADGRRYGPAEQAMHEVFASLGLG